MYTSHVRFCYPYVGDSFATNFYTTLTKAIRIYQKEKANVKMACVIKNIKKKKKDFLTSFYQKKKEYKKIIAHLNKLK